MLSTENLSFHYPHDPQNKVLYEINFDLKKGRVIGIIGANGSGKSTFFMNLLGILKPTSGFVLIDNAPLKYDKKSLHQLRQRVALVCQESDHQIFYTDIKNDLAFSLRNLGYDERIIQARTAHVLAAVNANAFQDKPIQYLSHGQKKRIAIAGALMLDSECLLLDEPTAGLDPKGRSDMVNLINTISAQDKKIIISSHDIDLIYETCDYVYILKSGHIYLSGITDIVLCDQDKMKAAGLSQPWLIKLHQNMGIPLYKTEADLYKNYMVGGFK